MRTAANTMSGGDRDTSLLFYHYNDDRATKVILRNSNTELLPAPTFRLGSTRQLSSADGRLSSYGGFGLPGRSSEQSIPYSHGEVYCEAMMLHHRHIMLLSLAMNFYSAIMSRIAMKLSCCLTGSSSALSRIEYS